jgi:hypothetical protein
MADAAVSNTAEGNLVWVRIPPSAPGQCPGARSAARWSATFPVTTDGIADMGHSWAAWFVDPGRNVLAVVQPKG